MKTQNINMRRSGFTIIELVITMSLMVIITAISISLIAISAKTAKLSNGAYTQVNELRLAKKLVQDWISSFDTTTYTFASSGGTLVASSNSEVRSCGITGGGFSAEYPGEDVTKTAVFTEIKATKFSLMAIYNNTGCLVSCTLTYNGGESESTFTYCLRAAAYTSEIIGEPSQEESSGTISEESAVSVDISIESSAAESS
jgi:type II secretory pathway pseudopilin PulG